MRNGTRPDGCAVSPSVSRHSSSVPSGRRRLIARTGPGSYPRALAAATAASRSGGETAHVTVRATSSPSTPKGRGPDGSG